MDKDRDMQILDANMGANTWVNKKPVVKPKAVPVKKIAPKMSDVPRDRGSDSARRPGAYEQARTQQSENDYRFSNGEGSEPREARASAYARHAKRDGTVYGDYPKNPTGPAIGGKHGKSWNGRD